MANVDTTYYTERLVKCGVPEHMHGGIVRYLLSGIEPGSFCARVLENDLAGAVMFADEINRNALANYVDFLYRYAPREAWGSPETVKRYLASFQEKR